MPRFQLEVRDASSVRVTSQMLVLAACLSAAWLYSAEVKAQQKSGADRFAVDLVTLKSGDRLRGALLGASADGTVSMAVQREWLKRSRPRFYEEATRFETASARLIATTLRDRIRVWQKQGGQSDALAAFLRLQLDDAENALKKLGDDAQGPSSQFVMLALPKSDITYHFVQPPNNRKIALLAWEERLKDVEQREASDLLVELKRRGLNPDVDTANLTARLPAEEQSDDQWAARQAIIEFHYEKKIEFQGMGQTLFRTGGEKQPGLDQLLPQLLPQLLEGQLAGQLGDLLNEPALRQQVPGANKSVGAAGLDLKPAIATAEQERVRGFRVARLDLQIAQGRARVTQQFVARLSNGQWKTIWQSDVTGDAAQARPEAQQQIKQDPQIAQALKLLESLSPGADQQVNVALKFGAATMDAQKKSDAQFYEFRYRFLQSLASPPLTWNNN